MSPIILGAILMLSPVNPGQFVGVAGEAVTLQFEFEDAQAEATFLYSIYDYSGNSVEAGQAERLESNRLSVVFTPLPGYYEIHFPEAEAVLGYVALPPRPQVRDPFFSVDAALTWLELDEDMRLSMIKQMEVLGVDMVRERISWSNIEHIQGEFIWEPARRKDSLRRHLDEAGLNILEMFHDAPAWAGSGQGNPYPRDLIATYQSWLRITQHWGAVWDAFEIWNEPEITFGGYLPADQYSAVAKVVSKALRDGGFNGEIGVGVFTHLISRNMLDAYYENDLLTAGHFVGFHTYEPVRGIAHQVFKFREWLRDSNEPTTPLWISESGWPWKRGAVRPPFDQDSESAHISIGKMIESRAFGVERHFAFVYPYYDENEHNFGMLGKEGTPLRAAAAYGQAVRTLSNTSYCGDWAEPLPGIDTARVFQNDDVTILVLIAHSTEAVDVNLEVVPKQVLGIDGRLLPLNDDGSVPVHDGMVYVMLESEIVNTHVNPDTQAAAMYALHQNTQPKILKDFPVVLQIIPDLEKWHATTRGYQLPKSEDNTHELRLRVNNLTETPQQVRLLLRESMTDTTVDAGVREVKAMAYEDILHDLRLDDFGKVPRKTLYLIAQDEHGKQLDQLLLNFIEQQSLEQLIDSFAYREVLPITELERWQHNIVGGSEMSMEIIDTSTCRSDFSFGDGDRWAYPSFRIPENINMARTKAVVLEARVDAPADARIMLQMRDGTTFYTADPIISDNGEWQSAIVWFDELGLMPIGVPEESDLILRLEDVTSIQFGMNSKTSENALEVRNVWLVGE